MSENQTGLVPLGRAVLVRPYEPEFAKSVIVRPDAVSERSMMVEMRAVVLDIGPSAWTSEPARAKVGDKVLVAKYAGVICKSPLTGELLRVVNDNDIFLRIDAEAMPVMNVEAA